MLSCSAYSSLTALASGSSPHQVDLSWASLLQTEAGRGGWEGLRLLQVPLDVQGCRAAPGGTRGAERDRWGNFQDKERSTYNTYRTFYSALEHRRATPTHKRAQGGDEPGGSAPPALEGLR